MWWGHLTNQNLAWRYTDVCGGDRVACRGMQRSAEMCREVYRGAWRCAEVCREVSGEVCRGVQRWWG